MKIEEIEVQQVMSHIQVAQKPLDSRGSTFNVERPVTFCTLLYIGIVQSYRIVFCFTISCTFLIVFCRLEVADEKFIPTVTYSKKPQNRFLCSKSGPHKCSLGTVCLKTQAYDCRFKPQTVCVDLSQYLTHLIQLYRNWFVQKLNDAHAYLQTAIRMKQTSP